MKLSVTFISFNEAGNIGRALDAVADIADEIIIVDSHSADQTVEIARSKGAVVYDEDWKGYNGQRNSSIQKCRGEWILALDCDEVLTPELRREIKELLAGQPSLNGYAINRRSFYMGKLLKYSWQPDRKLRLLRRAGNPRAVGQEPHDRLDVDGATGRLKNDLIHYSFNNFSDHMQRTVKHAKSASQSYYAGGRRARAWEIFLKPVFAFFKRYILKRGALDGVRGLIASGSGAYHVYMKYAFLWELQNLNGQKKESSDK